MNNIYESILEKLLLKEDYRSPRKDLFVELKKRIESTKGSNPANEIADLSAYIYSSILRVGGIRDKINIKADDFDSIPLDNEDFKKDFNEAINSFKESTQSLSTIVSAGWFQVNFKNAPGEKSKTAGQSDEEKFWNYRTHNIYFTFQYKDLLKDKKFADSVMSFGSAIKEFAEWCDEFNANTDKNKGIGIPNFKTLDITDKKEKLLFNKQNPVTFIQYFTEADNFKVYLSGINRSKDKSDVESVVNEIKDEVNRIFADNGFETSVRDRGDFGVDFTIQKQGGVFNRVSFGQVVSFLLANTLVRNEAIKKLVLDDDTDKFQENFFKLAKKAEECITNSANSSAIARIVISPDNNQSFRSNM